MNKIFNHGFTTKKGGHGFGLHSGANAAKEMGGSLTARSDAPGKGAEFTLELPTAAPSRKIDAANGRKKPDTTGGMPTRSAVATIAGSAASDDLEANATACAGAQNAMNSHVNGSVQCGPMGIEGIGPARSC